MSVVVNVQDEGRSMELDNGHQERADGGVGKGKAAVRCREGEAGGR